MVFKQKILKYVAYVVIVAYLSVFNAGPAVAAEYAFTINPQLLAQATSPERSSNTMTEKELEIRQRLYEERIRDIEAEMNSARGMRKNLLTVSIATLSAGATVNFAVETINSAIDDIPRTNPEEDEPSDCIEERYEDCAWYICSGDQRNEAQTSLDGIKGIGQGFLLFGAVGLIGFFVYSRVIKGKQEKVDALQTELSEGLGVSSGFSPDYLQRNETAAAIVEEINDLKKSAGSSRTIGEVFSTLAVSGILSGLLLVGVSNASNDLVDGITVDPGDPAEVSAKQDALDKTDSLGTIGWVLVGAGGVSGLASYLFHRRAKGKENGINDLEEGLLQIAGNMRIQPKLDGVMVMFSYDF